MSHRSTVPVAYSDVRLGDATRVYIGPPRRAHSINDFAKTPRTGFSCIMHLLPPEDRGLSMRLASGGMEGALSDPGIAFAARCTNCWHHWNAAHETSHSAHRRKRLPSHIEGQVISAGTVRWRRIIRGARQELQSAIVSAGSDDVGIEIKDLQSLPASCSPVYPRRRGCAWARVAPGSSGRERAG